MQERASVEKSIATRGPSDESRQATLLAAAADPIRLRILALVRKPRAVHEICRELGMAQPRVSHHLAILREADLVTVEPQGRRRLYRWAVDPPGPVRDLQSLLVRWFPTAGGPNRAVESGGEEGGEGRLGSAGPSPAAGDMDDYLL